MTFGLLSPPVASPTLPRVPAEENDGSWDTVIIDDDVVADCWYTAAPLCELVEQTEVGVPTRDDDNPEWFRDTDVLRPLPRFETGNDGRLVVLDEVVANDEVGEFPRDCVFETAGAVEDDVEVAGAGAVANVVGADDFS